MSIRSFNISICVFTVVDKLLILVSIAIDKLLEVVVIALERYEISFVFKLEIAIDNWLICSGISSLISELTVSIFVFKLNSNALSLESITVLGT